MRRHACLCVTLAITGAAPLTLAASAGARGRGPTFSIAIGYNGLPPAANGELGVLRYADDDAAAFHQFARMLTRRSFLLTLLDRETEKRFPALAAEARSPSLVDLRRTVLEVREHVAAAVARAEEPTVLVFYSGHGTRAPDGQGALTLTDGLITRNMLHDELLAAFPSAFVHLFVDACNAEAVVRSRDLQAEVVDPPQEDIDAALRLNTLARFPRVGAVLASTTGAQAHEWDVYRSGVFTHEVLSALRGAADINGDHRIEYSELAAFLAAANHDVSDPRAHARTIVQPPSLDRHVPIVNLDDAHGAAFLVGAPANLGAFFVEDARGNRLLDLRAESTLWVSLVLPADEVLYFHNDQGGAVLRLAAGSRLTFDHLSLTKAATQPRGALASALHRGLFSTPYGPDYYRGFVDQRDDLAPVEPRESDAGIHVLAPPADSPPQHSVKHQRTALVSFGASALLAVSAGIFGAMTWEARRDFQGTTLERPAQDAQNRYQRDLTLLAGSLAASVLSAGLGAYLLSRDQSAGR